MTAFAILGSAERTLRSWISLLSKLGFPDNIDSFEWHGTIAAGEGTRISHDLGVVPTRFLILDATGTNQIVRGDDRATDKFFYVKNVASTSTFAGKILILP